MQNYLTSARSIREEGAFYSCGKDMLFSVVDARDVEAAAARVLTATGHEGRAYTLSGPESLSNADIAEKLSAAAGKPIRYVDLPEADFRTALVSAGIPRATADGYIDLIDYYIAGKATSVSPDVERISGKPPGSFDKFARDFTAAFKPHELS